MKWRDYNIAASAQTAWYEGNEKAHDIGQGIKNTAQETYNNAKNSYNKGDGKALGEIGGQTVVNTAICLATTKGFRTASNSVNIINKADNLVDAGTAIQKSKADILRENNQRGKNYEIEEYNHSTAK